MNKHENYMMQAIIEGRKALAHSSPNPNVGAIVVKNNRIIGKGYTQIPGQAHAEVIALSRAGTRAKGASMYITLEACCHFGKTPPCTDLIIKKKIKEVYIGIDDPNPIVCSKGIKELIEHKINVKVGILKEKIVQELQWYLKFVHNKLPYITLKAGMTLDGKLTDYQGNSKWITAESSRQYLRELNDGIIAGINTVLKDNPLLTYRGNNKKKQFFYRIILDTNLKIDLKANVLKPVKNHFTLIAVSNKLKSTKKTQKFLELKNVEIIYCPLKAEKIDLKYLLKKLAERGITKLIVEGGSEVNYSFLKEKLVDKLFLFIAPKIIGGNKSKCLIGGEGFPLKQCVKIINGRYYNDSADDFIFEGYLNVYRNN